MSNPQLKHFYCLGIVREHCVYAMASYTKPRSHLSNSVSSSATIKRYKLDTAELSHAFRRVPRQAGNSLWITEVQKHSRLPVQEMLSVPRLVPKSRWRQPAL